MRKPLIMKYLVVLVSAVIMFSGCKKFRDYIEDHESQANTCKLDSLYPINLGIPAMDRTTALGVHYNSKGNPTLVNYTFNHYGTFQFPVHYKYDAKDRLIEILPIVDESVPDYLNGMPQHVKYVYEGNSKVPIRDTVFWNDPAIGDEVEELYYDSYDRVNRVIRKYTLDPSFDLETKYKYDANGNKQVLLAFDGSTPAPLVYSDKPSLYTLHPVWRIIHKDYSKNSLKAPLKTVTAQGLPESLYRNTISGYFGYEVHDAANPFTLFLGVESSIELRFTYKCSSTSK